MKIVRPMTQSDSASSGRASTGGWRAGSLRGGRPGGSMGGVEGAGWVGGRMWWALCNRRGKRSAAGTRKWSCEPGWMGDKWAKSRPHAILHRRGARRLARKPESPEIRPANSRNLCWEPAPLTPHSHPHHRNSKSMKVIVVSSRQQHCLKD